MVVIEGTSRPVVRVDIEELLLRINQKFCKCKSSKALIEFMEVFGLAESLEARQ